MTRKRIWSIVIEGEDMRILPVALLLTLAAAMPLAAQPNQADFTIDAQERKEAIEGSIARLKEAYVFPETALKMEKAVRERMAKGEYDHITSAKELATKLTDDFRAVSRDKHLGVFTDANGVPDQAGSDIRTPEEIERMRAGARRVNFGFEKVERLQGNVGYIDIRGFASPEVGAETGAAAMSFIANSDALIVDLRKNGGGEPAMIAFLTSYLFDAPTHLNDIYTEQTKSTQHYWTLPHVPGQKFGGKKPVYVLTSDYTFSGGEEFAYNLKNLQRATIIGETTGGGAHPVRPFKASRRFGIGVPFARAINPITRTNWEGAGVTPDIAMPADQAFDHAYKLALEALIEKAGDPRQKMQLENLLKEKSKP
jgi:retinol-binding protein 3